MSYTINPNAKNKWARNAENTMDLSLETDASSVYLDNGRTLEQEIGEGSMVSNVATVDSAMSKVIDGTLDGAYESLVFKGKSLVNIHPISYSIGAAGAVTYFANEDVDKTKIKSGTRYFLRLLDTDPTVCRAYFKPCNVNTISFADINDKYAIFTTKSELTDSDFSNNKIHFYTSTSKTLEDVANTKIILCEYQEGMENWDIPFFEGLCDVKMPILCNVGKNLFDINGDINQKFDNMLGSLNNVRIGENSFIANNYTHSHHGRGVFLNLKPNTEYTLSGHCENAGEIDFHTREQVNYLIRCFSGDFKWTINTGSYTNFCLAFITAGNSSANKAIFSNIQLEESLSPTPYENHKTNILRTPETIVLRSLPNGVRDELNLNTGEYTKHIGEIVLNGSEDWEYTNETFRSRIIRDKVFEQVTASDREKIYLICDKYKSIAYSAPWNSGEFIALHVSKQIVFRDERFNEVNDWKQYLSQNPVMVQYQLAIPITTTIEPLSIPFAYKNGHVIVESGFEGQSLLPTLEYSTVVNKTGQIESVAKTIQRQEKQLTMLEKMLIQNIINLDYNNTLLTLKNEMEEML